jgi:hypothetical protein
VRTAANMDETNVYAFESFRLDSGKRLVFNGEGECLPLLPKAFDILIYLVRHHAKPIIIRSSVPTTNFHPSSAMFTLMIVPKETRIIICSVLRGRYRYYGLPSNCHAMV